MTSKKPYPKSLLILIALGGIGAATIILGLISLAPSIKAISPMFKSANDGSTDDYENRRILSTAMTPTFQANDSVLVDKKVYKNTSPKRGDIIIFHPIEKLRKQNYKDPFVKRVIGLPGETIEIKNGKVYINNEPIVEEYISEPPEYTTKPNKIPVGNYYVLGDNRNNSYGSQYWGYVPQELIIGKVVNIYFPPSRVREFD